MKPLSLLSLSLVATLTTYFPQTAIGAEKMTVTVANDLDAGRPAETITVPWGEIAKRLPGTLPSHILVKDQNGTAVPSQLINGKPEEHRDLYESLIFQHDFAPGEHSATFTFEKTEVPVPPYPTKAFGRYIPERFDDFAWENDRIAHRIYGPGLNSPAAGKDRMISSGIDVWCKRVRYPIIDRWYLMGHYHEDSGEGLDMYDVGKSRGCGGTGVWDGNQLWVSQNWKSWKLIANGPVRVAFELTYEPWEADNGMKVSETKRFTLDADHNLTLVESSFQKTGDGELIIGIGIAKHTKRVEGAEPMKNEKARWFSLWEKYTKEGQLGTAVMVPTGALAGFAEDPLNYLVLSKATPGEPMRYYLGAGWERSGDFPDKASWEKYLNDFALRLSSPLKISFSAAK